jgi:hypothetical protein
MILMIGESNMRTILFVVLFFLTSCASTSESVVSSGVDIERYAAIGCASASSALKVLTIAVREGKLTDDQREMAVAAARKLAVICENPVAPTYEQLVQAGFDQAVLYLNQLALKQRVTGDRL